MSTATGVNTHGVVKNRIAAGGIEAPRAIKSCRMKSQVRMPGRRSISMKVCMQARGWDIHQVEGVTRLKKMLHIENVEAENGMIGSRGVEGSRRGESLVIVNRRRAEQHLAILRQISHIHEFLARRSL